MRKEIFEGPLAIEKTIKECMDEAEDVSKMMKEKGISKGFIVGSGTSFHASLHLQYLMTRYTNLGFTAIPASEFAMWVPPMMTKYAIIGFSQSGESTDIINAFNVLKEDTVKISVTNTPESTLTKISDKSIVTRAGEEKAVTATKTFDAQLTASYLLTFFLGKDTGELLERLNEIPGLLRKMLKEKENDVKEITAKHKNVRDVFILGHGINLPIAFEAALKLKEAATVHSEGFSTREFLHGPIQLVDKDSFIIFLLPDKDSYKHSESVINKVIKFNAHVLVIISENINIEEKITDIIKVPMVPFVLSPLILIKVIQLFTLHLSLVKGLNPDKPTKLTKVVKELT